jgi:hypothetical protein
MPELPSELLALICAATSARAAQVERRVQRLWDGYGEILRIRLEDAQSASVMVKWVRPPRAPADAAAQRSHARKLRSYQVECAFYEGYARACDDTCRVPRTIACLPRADGWLVVLEDLDAAGYGLRKRALRAAEVERCLDWLASFHATFMGIAPHNLWAEGSYWHLDTRPDELARVTDPGIRKIAPELDRALSACTYRTLVHGDAKLENFCFAASGAVSALDFQYVGGGAGVRDVCYFLSSCLLPERCARESQRYLDRYFVALRSAFTRKNSKVDADALEREWRRLFAVAWADFYRFLLGWSPEMARRETYGRELAQRCMRDGVP